MKPSAILVSAAGMASLLAPSTARAQVPDGHWVVSAFFTPGSSFPGPGGLFVAHPRDTTACMQPITGVPANLTGAPGPDTGANCVVIHPSGDLLVGEVVPAGTHIGVHRLPLAGLAVLAGATFLQLGTAATTGTQLAQMQLLDATTLVVGCAFVAGPFGASNPMQILLLDLLSGIATPVVNVSGLGATNALALDPANGNLVCGTVRVVAGATISQFHELPRLGPTTWGPPVLRATVTGAAVTSLCAHPGGGFVAGFDAPAASGNPALVRFSPAWFPTPRLTGFELANAVAVEPATGDLAFVGVQTRGNTAQPHGVLHLPAGAVAPTWITGCLATGPRGGLTGIACAPAPVRYGAPSGAVAVDWASTPNANALPLAGTTWSASTTWTVPPVFSAAALAWGAGPGTPLPQFGIVSWLDLTRLTPVLLPLAPTPQQSTLSLPLPPGSAGLTFFLQALHIDGTARLGATGGLRVRIL